MLTNFGNTGLFDQLVANELTRSAATPPNKDAYGNVPEASTTGSTCAGRRTRSTRRAQRTTRPNDNRVVVDSFRFST
ncbi:MAG: hypothetical protein U0835_12300 [Isosphaeraceae bacterium]